MVTFQKAFDENGFSLDRLRALLEVHQTGNIARASGGNRQRANLISRQITELENFFGTQFRKREGREVSLTPEGVEVCTIMKTFLKSMADFQDKLDGRPETLELGTGATLVEILFLPRLASLRDAAQGAQIMFRNMRSEEIVGRLASGELDLGVFSETRLGGKLANQPLGKVSYELYVPNSLLVSMSTSDPWKLIEELPFTTIDGQGEMKMELEATARSKGLEVKPELECSSFGLVAMAINSGIYCGILPSYFQKHFEESKVARLKVPGMHRLDRKYVAGWMPARMKIKERALSGVVAGLVTIFKQCGLT